MLERLVWKHDRVLLDDLVFRLQHAISADWDLGDECFILYKSQDLVDEYADFFSTAGPRTSGNVFELGIWEGGSVAFWVECLQPRKHVAADIRQRSDSDYFRKYISARGLETRVNTCWGVDQSDAQVLRDIVRQEFDGPLDLVIDDASHQYLSTRASFEALFPLMRPGGLYIIEDWAWAHWETYLEQEPGWRTQRPLTELVVQLLQIVATRPSHEKQLSPIRRMSVYHGFVVVERGEPQISAPAAFNVESEIFRIA